MTELLKTCSKGCPFPAQTPPRLRRMFLENGQDQDISFEINHLPLLTLSSSGQTFRPKIHPGSTRTIAIPVVRLIEDGKFDKLKHLIFSKNNLEKDHKIQ